MTTIKDRISPATTPPFFKRLRNWLGTIGSVLGVAAWAAPKIPIIPIWVGPICEIVSAALIGIAGTAHLTVNNLKSVTDRLVYLKKQMTDALSTGKQIDIEKVQNLKDQITFLESLKNE